MSGKTFAEGGLVDSGFPESYRDSVAGLARLAEGEFLISAEGDVFRVVSHDGS